ncbi:MAG: hypothetical protein AABZ94_07640 [Candidatus Eisenbacteria bacterium]
MIEFEGMMSTRIRRNLWLPTTLALLLIGVWAGIGLVHGHSGAPTCHVCNALQFTSADLVAPIGVAEPAAAALSSSPLTLPSAATPYPSTPPGRAPPLA